MKKWLMITKQMAQITSQRRTENLYNDRLRTNCMQEEFLPPMANLQEEFFSLKAIKIKLLL
jgi:hypothetical protein